MTKAERGALSAWLWRCSVRVGEVKGRTQTKTVCTNKACGKGI